MNNKGVLNNKGFTLVELLAVVTILVAFSLVAVTNVSSSLKRNNQQKEETQEDMLITAAKIYFSNNGLMKNGELVCVHQLVDGKYISYETIDFESYENYCVKMESSGYTITTVCNGACKKIY